MACLTCLWRGRGARACACMYAYAVCVCVCLEGGGCGRVRGPPRGRDHILDAPRTRGSKATPGVECCKSHPAGPEGSGRALPPPPLLAEPAPRGHALAGKVHHLCSEAAAEVDGAGQALALVHHARREADPVIVLAKRGGLAGRETKWGTPGQSRGGGPRQQLKGGRAARHLRSLPMSHRPLPQDMRGQPPPPGAPRPSRCRR